MNLKDYRERAGITRPAAAAKLGVHPTTYWRWETGKATPLPYQIARIRRWSKGRVTANDLVGGKP